MIAESLQPINCWGSRGPFRVTPCVTFFSLRAKCIFYRSNMGKWNTYGIVCSSSCRVQYKIHTILYFGNIDGSQQKLSFWKSDIFRFFVNFQKVTFFQNWPLRRGNIKATRTSNFSKKILFFNLSNFKVFLQYFF